jgi:hypothetical protein
MKIKRVFLIFAIVLAIWLVYAVSPVSAINLDIKKEAISDVIISEFNEPAVFNLTITNQGARDIFEIYSLVSVDISPKVSFELSRGESKEITLKVKASETIRKTPGPFPFVYKIKGENTGTQEDKLTINIVPLKDALQIIPNNVNTDSETITLDIENLKTFDFGVINSNFSSVFFSHSESFSLGPLEKKSLIIDLDKEKLGTLMAGPFVLDADMRIYDTNNHFESNIKFVEKSGILSNEVEEGIFIRRKEIEKTNEGNLPAVAEISIEKNILSRMFTTFSLPPSKTLKKGLTTNYTWVEELRPGESLKVIVRTNWVIPIVIIIACIIIVILWNIYLKSDLVLTKKISQVKTKGGEFALKVSINARARKHIQKINIIDKLPPIVKLYKRYGTISPDRIDEKNRRMEWNLESMNEGEERVLTYIIYSKIGVFGKFELPPAKAIYEKQARIKETQSNEVFFVSEPGKIREEK